MSCLRRFLAAFSRNVCKPISATKKKGYKVEMMT